jgi:ribosomal protein S27E
MTPGREHVMFTDQETIVRCKCGRELSDLRCVSDAKTGTRFLTERCEACGELTIIRPKQDDV